MVSRFSQVVDIECHYCEISCTKIFFWVTMQPVVLLVLTYIDFSVYISVHKCIFSSATEIPEINCIIGILQFFRF